MLTSAVRRISIAALVTAMVAAVLFAASRSDASGPVYADVGTLDLILDEAGTREVAFVADAGSGLLNMTEALGTQGACLLTESGPDVADFTAGPAGADEGLRKSGYEIGVKYNEGNGEPCARINDSGVLGQTLEISLGDELAGYKLDGGNVALKMKFGATAMIEAFDGLTSVGFLSQGCSGGPTSDCGADSGNDRLNFPITVGPEQLFSAPFDRIVISILEPSDGSAALIDDPNDTDPDLNFDTFFNVVEEFDGTLGCDDPRTVEGAFVDGTFIRLGSQETAESCLVEKFYRLNVEEILDGFREERIEFTPRLDGVPDSFYRGILTFDYTPTNPMYALQYDKDGPGPLDYVNVQWCGVDVGAGAGEFPTLNDGLDFPLLPTTNDSDGYAPTSCIVSLFSDADGPQVWDVLLRGDPFYR